MDIRKILDDHKKWLCSDGGKKADLSGANLSGADLRRANLRWANLSGADLPTDQILHTIFGWAHIQRDHIRIGCQYHSTESWRNFTDDEISKMESRALDWWKKWKPIVLGIADICEPYVDCREVSK